MPLWANVAFKAGLDCRRFFSTIAFISQSTTLNVEHQGQVPPLVLASFFYFFYFNLSLCRYNTKEKGFIATISPVTYSIFTFNKHYWSSFVGFVYTHKIVLETMKYIELMLDWFLFVYNQGDKTP